MNILPSNLPPQSQTSVFERSFTARNTALNRGSLPVCTPLQASSHRRLPCLMADHYPKGRNGGAAFNRNSAYQTAGDFQDPRPRSAAPAAGHRLGLQALAAVLPQRPSSHVAGAAAADNMQTSEAAGGGGGGGNRRPRSGAPRSGGQGSAQGQQGHNSRDGSNRQPSAATGQWEGAMNVDDGAARKRKRERRKRNDNAGAAPGPLPNPPADSAATAASAAALAGLGSNQSRPGSRQERFLAVPHSSYTGYPTQQASAGDPLGKCKRMH